MASKLWFKRKSYGWGWIPSSIEGWLVLLIYVVANVCIFRVVDLRSHSSSDTLINFAPKFLLITAGLYLICYVTSERHHR